jgi:hypothetical protein
MRPTTPPPGWIEIALAADRGEDVSAITKADPDLTQFLIERKLAQIAEIAARDHVDDPPIAPGGDRGNEGSPE